MGKNGINAFIWGGLSTRGAYTWSNTSVEEKVGLSEWGLYVGGLSAEKYGKCLDKHGTTK